MCLFREGASTKSVENIPIHNNHSNSTRQPSHKTDEHTSSASDCRTSELHKDTLESVGGDIIYVKIEDDGDIIQYDPSSQSVERVDGSVPMSVDGGISMSEDDILKHDVDELRDGASVSSNYPKNNIIHAGFSSLNTPIIDIDNINNEEGDGGDEEKQYACVQRQLTEILKALRSMDNNNVRNFRLLFERMDSLEQRVDALCRRAESEDSSFRLEKMETVDQFLLWEKKLKDDKDEYNLLVCMLLLLSLGE